MFHKFLPLFAVSFLFFFSSSALAQSFSDVPASHPYAEAIEYVKTQSIVSGYRDGTFKPDSTINRAEFLKILLEAKIKNSDIILNCIEQPFSDVLITEWYADYTCFAKEQGIIKGYNDGTFRPTQNISFAEASKIIVNTMIEKTDSGVGEIWYEPFIGKLEMRNAIPDSLILFKGPSDAGYKESANITRGEMAYLIYSITHDGDLPLVPCANFGGQNTIQTTNLQKVGAYDVSIQPSCIIILDPVKKEYAVFDYSGEFQKSVLDNTMSIPGSSLISGGFNVSLQGKILTMNIWKISDAQNYANQEMGPVSLPTGSFFSSDSEWESIAKKIDTKTFNLSFQNY